jgi:hypothetical protein
VVRLYQIKELFNRFNAVYFSSKLPKPHIKLYRARNYYGYWMPGVIVLSTSKNKTWDDWRDSLLHEMTHLYVDEVLKVKEPDHGPVWKEEALKRCVKIKDEYT